MAHTVNVKERTYAEEVAKHNEDVEAFETALEFYMNAQFIKETPAEKHDAEIDGGHYSKTSPRFIIKSMLMNGHVDLVEQILAREEVGLDPDQNAELKANIEILKKGFPKYPEAPF
jgi:hypothetical protein